MTQNQTTTFYALIPSVPLFAPDIVSSTAILNAAFDVEAKQEPSDILTVLFSYLQCPEISGIQKNY